MITESNQVFRITYEAFSKFSNNLNRCRSFKDIGDCFTVNLKYMFNFHVFRASYFRNGTYVHLESFRGKTIVCVQNRPTYLDYEELLLKQKNPGRWTELDGMQLPGAATHIQENDRELWGWNLINDDRQIIVSVLSGGRKVFGTKDINFLKLVSENLETKLLELCLYKELDEKNGIISQINEDQKQVIIERTSEIKIKNKTLLEISVLNAHTIREPLSRILGLINLIDEDVSEDMIAQVLPHLKSSSNDLDEALQNVIEHATRDLLELKA